MKRQVIYKEVLSMLNSGCDYSAITLLEVARRCGMGKSTLYDYFSSKDEMIFNSIIFYINKMLKFFSSGFRITKFEQSLKTYIQALMISMKSNFWMVLPYTFRNCLKYLSESDAQTVRDLLDKSQQIMIALLNSICKVGRTEDAILTIDRQSIRFIYFGIVGEISCVIHDSYDTNSADCKDLIQRLVKNIIKQLK